MKNKKIYTVQKVAYTHSKNWNWTGYVISVTCLDMSRDYQFSEFYSDKFGGVDRFCKKLEGLGCKVLTYKDVFPLPMLGVRDWSKLSDIDLVAINSDGTITDGDKFLNK